MREKESFISSFVQERLILEMFLFEQLFNEDVHTNTCFFVVKTTLIIHLFIVRSLGNLKHENEVYL